MRAAEKIRLRKLHEKKSVISNVTELLLREEVREFVELPKKASGTIALGGLWKKAAKRMSACGGMIRNRENLESALEETEAELEGYLKLVKCPSEDQLPMFYRLRDMLISQKVYLFAMLDYAKSSAGSRGSALYTDKNGRRPDLKLPELYRCRLDQGMHGGIIQEILLNGLQCSSEWRSVRPIPEIDYFFENQWKAYRDREKV